MGKGSDPNWRDRFLQGSEDKTVKPLGKSGISGQLSRTKVLLSEAIVSSLNEYRFTFGCVMSIIDLECP